MEGLRDMVLGEFKDVFGATARHCVLDAEFESKSFSFERFFLGNLAYGSVVPLEEELYSDSDDGFSPASHIQYEKSSYENRFDVLFDKLALTYELSEDTVSLHWTSMVSELPRYLRDMISSYLMDLLLEQRSLFPADHGGQQKQWRHASVNGTKKQLHHCFYRCQEGQSDTKQQHSMAGWLNPQSALHRTSLRKRSWLLLKALKQIRWLNRVLPYRKSCKRTYLHMETDFLLGSNMEPNLITERDPEIPDKLLFESIYIPTMTDLHEPSFIIPYESFNGSMLGPTFQIKGAIGRDSYGEIYQIEDLSGTFTCTAKAYHQVSISEKDRMYKARSIRRREKWPTYMGCIEQSGKKFLVFQETTVDVSAQLPKQPTVPTICDFDRSSVTFNTDFPKLPRRPIPVSDDGYMNREKSRTGKKKSFAAKSAVSASRTYAYVTRMPGPVQEERQKTVHQAERKKARQREKRQRERGERAKLRRDSENAT
ncbi:hypothetical protein MMC17_007915 [Xylographa soralifera]|nr:hypothetical protein [Xylographa soralifera]